MTLARLALGALVGVVACGGSEVSNGATDAGLADGRGGDAPVSVLPDARSATDARTADARPAADARIAPDSPPAADAGSTSCHVDVEVPAGCTQSSCRQLERRLASTTCITQGYLEYTPPGYGDGALRPLLLFYHGIGENGDGVAELANVANAGPPALIKGNKWPLDREFIVLSPQHFARPATSCHSVGEIKAMVAYATANYDVDRTRIYLTGLSCGGIGIWNYLGSALDTQGVVAMVPIAGDGRSAWNQQGCKLGRVAIWAFHNDHDPTVNSLGTTVPVTNLTTMCQPVPDVQMTIYTSTQHDSWSKTYDLSAGHDIYTWLLQHHR